MSKDDKGEKKAERISLTSRKVGVMFLEGKMETLVSLPLIKRNNNNNTQKVNQTEEDYLFQE